MNNMLKADLYKISKLNVLKICFLICTVSILAIAYVQHGVYTKALDSSLSNNFSLLADCMLVSLLGSVLTANLISNDFESKNIHSEITGGYGRFSIVMEKTVAYAILILIITFPYAFVSVLCFSSGAHFAPFNGIPSSFIAMMCNNAGVEISGQYIAKSIIIAILVMLTYVGRLSICLPFAFKTKRTIPVIIIGFVSAFIFDILYAAVKNIDILGRFVNILPYRSASQLTLDASSCTIIKVFISTIVFIALMVAITYSLFRKDEIK